MAILECTSGAVGASTMRVAAAVRPAPQSASMPSDRSNLQLPTVRLHSLAGVGLYEVQGLDNGWGGLRTDVEGAVTGIDPTAFPTRLGPPPDHPPVN